MDLRGRHPRMFELAARDVRHVEIKALATFFKPFVHPCTRVPGSNKGVNEFRTDFVTAGADVRTDRHLQVRSRGSELIGHCLDTCADRACGQPAPPRMDGADGSGVRVGDEHRDTVCRLDCDRRLRVVGDDDVCGWPDHDRLRRFAPDNDDIAPVHLVSGDDSTRRPYEGRDRSPAILRQLKLTGGEEMRGHDLEGATPEQGTLRERRPGKGFGNRRQWHTLSGQLSVVSCCDRVMDIIGTGLDATEISRVASAIERFGDRFIRRVFTEGEIAYCQRKRDSASSFAARFAAKEAAMKALGTGHSRGVFWQGIEVVRRSGPPQLRFHAGAAARFTALGATGSLLTLTHSRELAIAHVLLLR